MGQRDARWRKKSRSLLRTLKYLTLVAVAHLNVKAFQLRSVLPSSTVCSQHFGPAPTAMWHERLLHAHVHVRQPSSSLSKDRPQTAMYASSFDLESLLRLPKDPAPSPRPSTSSASSAQDTVIAAVASAAECERVIDRLERGLSKLKMIHGWCISPADAAFLDKTREELKPLVNYLPGRDDQAKIETALQVAYHAHMGQVRRSGEPFVRHPIEVAKILTELRMDADSIAAGLLHDTVEDTPVSVADIQAVFGAAVRRLVEGETKVSKLPKRLSRAGASEQVGASGAGGVGGADAAEVAPPLTDDQLANLLHLLMAMAQDFRVLVVKLADRLHNMRTLGFMSPTKQEKIARETLDVYVPLARKLGVWRLKTELEDLAFKTLHAPEHAAMTRALDTRRELLASLHTNRFGSRRLSMTAALTEALPRLLKSRGALKGHDVTVRLESKQPYQLFARDTAVEGAIDTQPDLLTLKVVVSSEHVAGPSSWSEGAHYTSQSPSSASQPRRRDRRDLNADRALCMMVLEEIQTELRSPSSHSRVRDYISFPLDNGYQALHDELRVPGFPFPLEVHVNTDWMEQVAQYGLLALWDGPASTEASLDATYIAQEPVAQLKEQHETHAPNQRLQSSAVSAEGASGSASAGDSATAVPLELGWLQSLSAQTKRVVRDKPSMTAQQLIGTLQEQLAVKRLVLTSDGNVLSLDVPQGKAGVTVRDAAAAQLSGATASIAERSSESSLTGSLQQLEVAGASVNGQPVSLSRPLLTGDVVDFVYRAKGDREDSGAAWSSASERKDKEALWIWQAPLFVWPWCLIGNADSSSSSRSSSSSSKSGADLLSNKVWGVSTRSRQKGFGQVKLKDTESVWDSGEIIWLRECELRHGRLSLGALAYGMAHTLVAALGASGMEWGMGDVGLDLTAAAASTISLEGSGAERICMDVASAACTGAATNWLRFAPWVATAFPPLSSLECFQMVSLVGAGEVLGGIVPETVAFNMRYQDMRRRRRAGENFLDLSSEEASLEAAARGHSDDSAMSGSGDRDGRGEGLQVQQSGLVGGNSAYLTRTIPLGWLKEQERLLGRLGMVTTAGLALFGALG